MSNLMQNFPVIAKRHPLAFEAFSVYVGVSSRDHVTIREGSQRLEQ